MKKSDMFKLVELTASWSAKLGAAGFEIVNEILYNYRLSIAFKRDDDRIWIRTDGSMFEVMVMAHDSKKGDLIVVYRKDLNDPEKDLTLWSLETNIGFGLYDIQTKA